MNKIKPTFHCLITVNIIYLVYYLTGMIGNIKEFIVQSNLIKSPLLTNNIFLSLYLLSITITIIGGIIDSLEQKRIIKQKEPKKEKKRGHYSPQI